MTDASVALYNTTVTETHTNSPNRYTETRHATPGNACTHFLKFDMTCDEYDQLKARAAGLCELCQTPERKTTRGSLVIDHFEGGGVWFVRGLVCDRCNSVMSRHDRANEWGPASLPWADQARAYHLNAWGKPSAEDLAKADEYIQARKPFSVRNLPRRLSGRHESQVARVRLDRGPKQIARSLRKHLTTEQIGRLIELLRAEE
jgi:hypothetical protein